MLNFAFNYHSKYKSSGKSSSIFKKTTFDCKELLTKEHINSLLLPTGSLISMNGEYDSISYLDYDLLTGSEETLKEIFDKLPRISASYDFLTIGDVHKLTAKDLFFTELFANGISMVESMFAGLPALIDYDEMDICISRITPENFNFEVIDILEKDNKWEIDILKDRVVHRAILYASAVKMKKVITELSIKKGLTIGSKINKILREPYSNGIVFVAVPIVDSIENFDEIVKDVMPTDNFFSCTLCKNLKIANPRNKKEPYKTALVFTYMLEDGNEIFVAEKLVKKYFGSFSKFRKLHPALETRNSTVYFTTED